MSLFFLFVAFLGLIGHGSAAGITNPVVTATAGCSRVDVSWSDFYVRSSQQVQPPVPVDNGLFGTSVALSSDGLTFVVGSPSDKGTAGTVGSITIFSRSSIAQNFTFSARFEGAADNVQLGTSVAINDAGTVIAASALNEAMTSKGWGAVHIYTKSGATWSKQNTLTSRATTFTPNFGQSLSLNSDGTVLAMSSPLASNATHSSLGSVFVFQYKSSTGWDPLGSQLFASDASAGQQFGYQVSLSKDGSVLVVDTLTQTVDQTNNDQSYVFVLSGSQYNQVQRIASSRPIGGSAAGHSQSRVVDGSMIVVSHSTVISVWNRVIGQDAWAFDQQLITGNEMWDSNLETPAISADGKTIAVSSSSDNAIFTFVMVAGDWKLKEKLTGFPNGVALGRGGALAASADGSTILAGGRYYTDALQYSGSAFALTTSSDAPSLKVTCDGQSLFSSPVFTGANFYNFTEAPSNWWGSCELSIQTATETSTSASSDTVYTPALPDAATNLVAIAQDGAALLKWNDPQNVAVIDSEITSTDGFKTTTTNNAQFTVTGLTNGQSYTFSIRGRTACGYGPVASFPSVTPVAAVVSSSSTSAASSTAAAASSSSPVVTPSSSSAAAVSSSASVASSSSVVPAASSSGVASSSGESSDLSSTAPSESSYVAPSSTSDASAVSSSDASPSSSTDNSVSSSVSPAASSDSPAAQSSSSPSAASSSAVSASSSAVAASSSSPAVAASSSSAAASTSSSSGSQVSSASSQTALFAMALTLFVVVFARQ